MSSTYFNHLLQGESDRKEKNIRLVKFSIFSSHSHGLPLAVNQWATVLNNLSYGSIFLVDTSVKLLAVYSSYYDLQDD